jgi:hypothetical protein
MLWCIRKQSHIAGLFNCYAQATLVLGARSSFAAWLDFTTIRNETFKEAISVLIIDFTDVIVAKLANFAAGATAASRFSARRTRGVT